MKKNLLFLALIVAFAANFCVAQNTSRGVKLEKEECEEMALQMNTNPRASGSGTSSSEAIAFNTAKLQARNELAAQLAAEISGIVKHHAEQYQFAHTTASLERDSMVIVQKVSQILTKTVPICKNTYQQPDGSVKVYVCMEMDLNNQRKAYKELKEEGVFDNGTGKKDIDLNEAAFLIELAKAREEYNAKKEK